MGRADYLIPVKIVGSPIEATLHLIVVSYKPPITPSPQQILLVRVLLGDRHINRRLINTICPDKHMWGITYILRVLIPLTGVVVFIVVTVQLYHIPEVSFSSHSVSPFPFCFFHDTILKDCQTKNQNHERDTMSFVGNRETKTQNQIRIEIPFVWKIGLRGLVALTPHRSIHIFECLNVTANMRIVLI